MIQYLSVMKFAREILPNGLRVITIPMESVKSATVLVLIGAGSRYETKENNGLSHFLEHMAFKGTQKRPTAMDITTLIDGMGAQNNAFTGKEVIGFFIKAAADHADDCLDILSDIILNSKFPEEEIEREKGVIIEEINMYEDTPIRNVPDVYERLVFGDTPLGWDTAGRKEVISATKREDFINYMSRLYSPQNMAVIIAGGINPEKIVGSIGKYFGQMKSFDILPAQKIQLKQTSPGISVKRKKTEQLHFALGFTTCSLSSADRYPLAILSAILGGSMSSRLFDEVREKRGLCYYIRTMSDHYTDNGALTTFVGVKKDKIEEAIKVIINQYKKVREEAVGEEELKKTKDMLRGNMVLELENSRSVAGFFGEQEILGQKLETPEKVLAKTDAVMASDIQKVAQKYFLADKLNLAIIGEIENEEKLKGLLVL
jgi:predicted Zn-dependent peptidase